MIPSALDRLDKIIAPPRGKRFAVFLDYDGTLTPIVDHPEDAWLSDSMRQVLRELTARVPVAIRSGRDLDDVRRRIDGKKVFELLPAIEWDKGKAVLWLLEALALERENVRPIYIGDDSTDEDAFRALKERGVGILVSEQPQPTAAIYSLKNPAEVEGFLRALTARLP